VENARKEGGNRVVQARDAAELIKKTHHTKFNETVETCHQSGCGSKHSDQVVRGTVVSAPRPRQGRSRLVLAGGDKSAEPRKPSGIQSVATIMVQKKSSKAGPIFDAVIAYARHDALGG